MNLGIRGYSCISKCGTFARGGAFALALVLICQPARAQVTYSKGQSVSPAYEGWEPNPDGSFNLVFGYMNSNWEEEFNVPIGPGNNIEPGGPDRGQPTHLFPRRNRFVFRVRVPKDFGDKELVWTLTTNGKTLKAYGMLRQDYMLDNMVYSSEGGAIAGGVSNPEIRANKPPVLRTEGDSARTVKVGEPLTLVAHASDDGVPKRARSTVQIGNAAGPVKDARMIPPMQVSVGSATGLWVACYLYRGASKVTFSPLQPEVWEDTRAGGNSQWSPLWEPPIAPSDGTWTVQATFTEPGTYVLRWHATDGALWADQDITVIVTR
jgi:hypothetical protein